MVHHHCVMVTSAVGTLDFSTGKSGQHISVKEENIGVFHCNHTRPQHVLSIPTTHQHTNKYVYVKQAKD